MGDDNPFREELVASTVELRMVLDGVFPSEIRGAVRPNSEIRGVVRSNKRGFEGGRKGLGDDEEGSQDFEENES